MTSGQFASFAVSSIWVDRDERQRKKIDDIAVLAASIEKIGLINPPVIERDGRLRAGERRWTAVKLLGWTHMPVQFVDELDESGMQLLELEENLKRSDLPWQDECLAVARYHKIKLSDESTWTVEQTAEMLGMSRQVLGQRMLVARELSEGNKRVIEAPKFSVAKGVATRERERAASSAVKVVTAASASPNLPAVVDAPPLILGDFHEWAGTYKGEPFNVIHCDFPYGVGADTHDQGQAKSMGGYADTAEIYWDLMDTLSDCMSSIISPSAHLMFWFSMDYYEQTRLALIGMGWDVSPFPLIWYKSDNAGILPDSNRGPRRGYETAFFASRGDRKLTAKGAVNNVCAWPGRNKELHMSEKPVGMLKHFMGMIIDGYSRVLDPTAGSGNALKVASSLGASAVLGIEKDPEFYNRSIAAYWEK